MRSTVVNNWEAERIQRRMLLEAQEEEFASALAIDRQSSHISDLEPVQTEISVITRKVRHEKVRAAVPTDIDVPVAPHGIEIAVQPPNGPRMKRRFLLSSTSKAVYDWLYFTFDDSIDEGITLNLFTSHPRIVLPDDEHSLEEHGIVKSAILMLHFEDTNSDDEM